MLKYSLEWHLKTLRGHMANRLKKYYTWYTRFFGQETAVNNIK